MTRGLGISKIINPLRRILWRRILTAADTIYVRDIYSATNAQDLVSPEKVVRTADMAFLRIGESKAPVCTDASRDRILVAPCIDSTENRSINGPALTLIMRMAKEAIPDSDMLVVCHDTRPGMDEAAAKLVRDQIPEENVGTFLDFDLEKLKMLYCSAGLVITNRLHSVIFSILADAPVIVIDDGTTKLRAIAEAFDIPLIGSGSALTETTARHYVAIALSPDWLARAITREKFYQDANRNLK